MVLGAGPPVALAHSLVPLYTVLPLLSALKQVAFQLVVKPRAADHLRAWSKVEASAAAHHNWLGGLPGKAKARAEVG